MEFTLKDVLKQTLDESNKNCLSSEVKAGDKLVVCTDGIIRIEEAHSLYPEEPIVKYIPPSKTTATIDQLAKVRKVTKNWSPDYRTGLLDYTIGQPDWCLPSIVFNELRKALQPDRWNGHFNPELTEFCRYSPRRGIPELLDLIATKHKFSEYHLSPNKHLMVSAGVKALLYMAIQTLVRPGDIVLYFSPTYGTYQTQTLIAGGNPVDIPLDIASGIPRIDFNKLSKKIDSLDPKRIKIIIICSPNNPTSTVISSKEMRKLGDLMFEKKLDNAYLLSDEIYNNLYLSGSYRCRSILDVMCDHSIRNRMIIFNGFSKLHAMSGLRLGYAISPDPEVIRLMLIYQDNILSCAPTLTQKLAISFLRDERHLHWSDDLNAMVNDRLNVFASTLRDCLDSLIIKEIVTVVQPQAGFYCYLIIRNHGSGMKWVKLLLEEAQVACVPGEAFGERLENAEIRFSLGCLSDLDAVEDGARRIGLVILNNAGGKRGSSSQMTKLLPILQ